AAVSKPPFRAGGATAQTRRFVNRRSLGLLLFITLFVTAFVDWFSATTQRLYVDEDSAPSQQQGTVWQHFGVRGHEVVPEIITSDEARFTFPISLATRQTLRFTAHPDGEASYEISLATGGTSRQLVARRIDRPQP